MEVDDDPSERVNYKEKKDKEKEREKEKEKEELQGELLKLRRVRFEGSEGEALEIALQEVPFPLHFHLLF